MLIPIWNFERKLKIMLNLCYLQHLFRILAITCCSKFQLIRDWFFCKEIQFSTTFLEIEKTKFQLFLGQKCVSNCCWNGNVFLAFLKIFTGCIYFSIQFIFQKNFLLKLREGISLSDKLEHIWYWSPFEILRENWR